MNTRAFTYLRCSGRGQIDGDTWERQTEVISRFLANRPDLSHVCHYVEPGICGALEDRPVLAQMFLDLDETGIKLVIIEKLDRLARDLMTQENIIRDLRRRGVELVSVYEPDLCSDDPTRKLMRQIMGAIAEFDRHMIIARTRAARQRIRSRGQRCEGRKPFGFRPHETETLARMTVMAADGYTWTAIANELNEAGMRPRKGSKWFPATVGRILRRSEKSPQSAYCLS